MRLVLKLSALWLREFLYHDSDTERDVLLVIVIIMHSVRTGIEKSSFFLFSECIHQDKHQ